jgi:hypothetical protein
MSQVVKPITQMVRTVGQLSLVPIGAYEPPAPFRKAAHDAGYAAADVWVIPIGKARPI